MSPAPKKSKFSNALEALRSETVVVADTGDVAAMEQYKPTDATTNPSLVLACLRKLFLQKWLRIEILILFGDVMDMLAERYSQL